MLHWGLEAHPPPLPVIDSCLLPLSIRLVGMVQGKCQGQNQSWGEVKTSQRCMLTCACATHTHARVEVSGEKWKEDDFTEIEDNLSQYYKWNKSSPTCIINYYHRSEIHFRFYSDRTGKEEKFEIMMNEHDTESRMNKIEYEKSWKIITIWLYLFFYAQVFYNNVIFLEISTHWAPFLALLLILHEEKQEKYSLFCL